MQKQKLLGGAIGLVLLAGLGFKYYEYKNPEEFKELTDTVSLTTSTEKSSDVNVGAFTQNNTALTIERNKPVNPTRFGVIEVGAKGFNAFVIDADKDDNWEVVNKEFGESLAYEGFATTEDVKTGLKKHLSVMFDKGVRGKNAHFVISSGALKNPKTELIAKAIEQMGYVVNRVDADQEGKFALKSLVPHSEQTSAMSVDIGSGNTKITWFENGRLKSVETPGSKFFQDGHSEEEIIKMVQDALNQVPTHLKKRVYIIGGTPFKLAKESKKGEGRFTLLESPDRYSPGDDVSLKSGLIIYNALYESLDKDSQIIFDWDANFTIGFLLNIN